MSVYFKYLKKKNTSTLSDFEQPQTTGTIPDKSDDIVPLLIEKGVIIICALCVLGMSYYMYLKGYFTTETGLLMALSLLLLFLCGCLRTEKYHFLTTRPKVPTIERQGIILALFTFLLLVILCNKIIFKFQEGSLF